MSKKETPTRGRSDGAPSPSPTPRKKTLTPIGTFRPAPPRDSDGVLRIYAIATRIVTERPDLFDDVDGPLRQAMRGLRPPASLCAGDCERMWQIFARVARSPKVSLRLASGKALYRDLDAIGQRLDLMPLPRWQEAPLTLADEEPAPRKLEAMSSETGGDTIDTVRVRAKGKTTRGELDPPTVLRLLRTLSTGEQERLLVELVRSGTLVRTDALLLSQLVHQGREVGPEDEALQETLNTVGAFLAR